MRHNDIDRRDFLKAAGAAAIGAAAGPALGAGSLPEGSLSMPQAAKPAVRFGLDLYSLQSQTWTPIQYLDQCAKWGVKVVHFSEIRFIGGLDAANLRAVRAHADTLNLELEIGMRSLCPTSAMFDKNAGTFDEQLDKMLAAAKIVRSPIVRCVLGSAADRRGDGGIDRHIDAMAGAFKSARSRIADAGVKMAIENHAGDMQARELKRLVEAAGPDIVGVCIDSGNPVWTIEDPHLTLDTLAPYVLTSHMRDSALWMTPQGIASRWTRMGDGNMGMEDYIRTYVQKCPGKAVSLEVIVSANPRISNYRDPQFWDLYRTTPAWEFARFLALAEKGTPSVEKPREPTETAAQRQLADCEASVKWTKAFLEKL